ncbi:hypothetical protein NL676_024462 [Syzygium grande]|nr:hypothetical protein NL676_024462 [Syzygium grande]
MWVDPRRPGGTRREENFEFRSNEADDELDSVLKFDSPSGHFIDGVARSFQEEEIEAFSRTHERLLDLILCALMI